MALDQYPEPFQSAAFDVFKVELATHRRSLDAVRAGGATTAAHQVRFYRRMDEAIASLPEPEGEQLACNSGCSYCCHYHVYIFAAEALAIAEHIKATMPANQQAAITQKLKANAEHAARLGFDQHILTNIPCALLSETGACNIYPLRPSACRRHHSYDVTPCRVTFDNPHDPGQNPQSPAILAFGDAMMAATAAASHQAGFDSSRYEMSGAVYEALTNRASGRRWRDGKSSFPSVLDRYDELAGE